MHLKVLVANKFWYRRGGLENVMFDEVEGLESRGHATAHFSTSHPANDPSPWSDYFIDTVDLSDPAKQTTTQKVRTAVGLFYNAEAARRFGRLVDAFRPDIIHIHGIHRQISPSVLRAARSRGVPVVQTLHDYHHVCPADVLLYGGHTVCNPRRCGVLWYGAAVRGRCSHGSLAMSALSASETSFQRVFRAYERGVDRFISPSRFLADRMADAGWEIPTDIVLNAARIPGARSTSGRGVCVIGRLAPEKGVHVAIEAAEAAGVPITVAGDGPLGEELRSRFPAARFTGRLQPEEVQNLVRGSVAVIVPSLWYENAPMAVIETMAAGVPVIASRIGGIPEYVADGVDGLLVPPGDVRALAAAIRRVVDDTAFAQRIGAAARVRAQDRFTHDAHLDALLMTYDKAIRGRA